MHIRIQDGEVSEWQDLGFIIADEIECVNRDAGVIDVVVLDINHALVYSTLSDEVWGGWVLVGGTLMEVPSCAVRSSTIIACMARGTNNAGYYIGAHSGKWTKYYDMQGSLMSSIGCVTRGVIFINCFASGTNLHLYNKYWSKAGWGGWQDLGGLVKGRPSVTTWNLTTSDLRRIDVFSLGVMANNVVQKTWDGVLWLEWVDLGGTFASSPECVTTGVNKIHCFAVGVESDLYKNDYESGWWSGWTSVRVKCIETPSCVVSNPNVVSCYCRDFDQSLIEMVFDYN